MKKVLFFVVFTTVFIWQNICQIEMVNDNVTIGNANPDKKLKVLGTSELNGKVTIGTAVSNVEKFYVLGNGKFSGNLLINDNETVATISNSQTFAGTQNFDKVIIGLIPNPAPTERLFLSGDGKFSGNLFLGTSGSSNKLQVTGNTYITGNLGLGVDNNPERLFVDGDSYLKGNVDIFVPTQYREVQYIKR